MYGTPKPENPIAAKEIINRSVRSAIPPEHSIPKHSALARIYGTNIPVTKVTITTIASESSLLIR
jgi:hypothetical protein